MTDYSGGGSGATVSLFVKKGTDSIAIGSTTKSVAHGLGYVPTGYVVSPTVDSLGVDIYVSSVDATYLYVAMDFVQAGTTNFSWVCA